MIYIVFNVNHTPGFGPVSGMQNRKKCDHFLPCLKITSDQKKKNTKILKDLIKEAAINVVKLFLTLHATNHFFDPKISFWKNGLVPQTTLSVL